MVDEKRGRASSYLAYLPAVYSEDPVSRAFLERFLLAFEHVLTGLEDSEAPGFEEILDGTIPVRGVTLAGLQRYFDTGHRRDGVLLPAEQRAPAEFLDWLGEWVAVVRRGDLSESLQRELIARAVELYGVRGTKQGLLMLLEIFNFPVTIEEPTGSFQIGISSKIGVDTVLDGATPHYFSVRLRVATANVAEVTRQERALRALIDAEKPAHTHYDLTLDTDVRFELDDDLELGVNTVIG